MKRHLLTCLAAIGALAVAAGPALSQEGGSDDTSKPPTPAKAGTVKSFTEGVLAIELNDGSVVSGRVIRRTHVICVPKRRVAQAAQEGQPPDRPEGDRPAGDRPEGDRPQGGDDPQGERPRPSNEGDDQGDRPRPKRRHRMRCGPRALKPGTPVLHAHLALIPRGAVWDEVVLLADRPEPKPKPEPKPEDDPQS